MSYYALIFVAAVAASWHCAGMCGGFACALAGACRTRDAALRQLLYNAGRATSYCFLGAVAGALTAGLCTAAPAGPPVETAQRALAVVSGLVMLVIGARFFGLLRTAAKTPGLGGEMFARALGALGRTHSPAAPLAFGVFNGFLPCPLVYGFLAQAAASADAVKGLAIMAAFGLGTFPAMLAMGGLGHRLARRLLPAAAGAPASGGLIGFGADWRNKARLAAGGLFVLIGLITLARGIFAMHIHGQPI